jgi:hypothetical protein
MAVPGSTKHEAITHSRKNDVPFQAVIAGCSSLNVSLGFPKKNKQKRWNDEGARLGGGGNSSPE